MVPPLPILWKASDPPNDLYAAPPPSFTRNAKYVRLIIDDQRIFTRYASQYLRTTDTALTALRRLRERDDEIDELWIDCNLGIGQEIDPILELLKDWKYNTLHPLKVKAVYILDDIPELTLSIRNDIEFLGYPYKILVPQDLD